MKIDDTVVKRLKKAKKAFTLTGAGSSAPSGIPTFRGNEGFWENKNPFTIQAFEENPQEVWKWHQKIKKLISEKTPNPSHFALAKMQEIFGEFTVITQNIDNLHQRAGSVKVIELHGNIYKNRCNNCGKDFGEIDSEQIPKCDRCGGLIRPDVVWFGEPLPYRELMKARLKAEDSDVCFVVGTSGVVQPAASIPLIARENGAFVIEINTEKTVLSEHLDYSIFGDASEILPEICVRLF
jgi:NAD-dependent deacetylase